MSMSTPQAGEESQVDGWMDGWIVKEGKRRKREDDKVTDNLNILYKYQPVLLSH